MIDQLAAIVGADHLAAAAGLAVQGVVAPLAVSPATPAEAAAVLAAARAAGAAVTPWGGGTQQRAGAPPARLDVLLRTERLNRVVEHEPADLTAGLEAGITLAAAQQALAVHGQQLPIDAPNAERATLGGLVAVNVTGPRRWLYGGWRDLIIGMHMALPDGAVIKSGGRVVKNVQGYDLAKLFTGALGTLGVIGQVNVRLVPLPEARRLLACRGPLAACTAFLAEVAGSTLRTAALDVLDGNAARACGVPGDHPAALVLLEGPPVLVEDHTARLGKLATAAGLTAEEIDGAALASVWRAWVDLARVDDLGAEEGLLTLTVLPAEVPAALERIAQAADAQRVTVQRWARAGTGSVFARLSTPGGAARVALPAVHAGLLARWPGCSLIAGDPAAARPWGADPEGLPVMRALKSRFDPAGVLQPGRYTGGI